MDTKYNKGGFDIGSRVNGYDWRRYIYSGMTFIDDYKITIGKGCLFGTNVTLCTTGHPIDPEERAKGSMYSFPIVI